MKVLAEADYCLVGQLFLAGFPYWTGGGIVHSTGLSMTFAGMNIFDVGLHKISLGC
jgi:hypothetical protein